MTVLSPARPVTIGIAARRPLAGMVSLAVAHLRTEPHEVTADELESLPADLAIIDEASRPSGLAATIQRLSAAGTPVLVLVRRRELEAALEAVRAGATEVLRVPFDPIELVLRACAALHGGGRTVPELNGELKVGKLDVDLLNGRIHMNGTAPHLTPLERGLLYVLVSNAGRVVSREDIIDCVWGADAEPNSNLVDRHIRDLRRKLQDDWRRPNILATLRGHGYMVPLND
jgi:DNA-binding response OmpR family regulator